MFQSVLQTCLDRSRNYTVFVKCEDSKGEVREAPASDIQIDLTVSAARCQIGVRLHISDDLDQSAARSTLTIPPAAHGKVKLLTLPWQRAVNAPVEHVTKVNGSVGAPGEPRLLMVTVRMC